MALAVVVQAGLPAAAEEPSPAADAGRLDLPFASGARWTVVPPADGRLPDRGDAWAVSFTPVDGADESVLAPAAGRVRLIVMRPSMSPSWCPLGATWNGPQREVQIDLDDGQTVAIGYLDDLAVADGERVVVGQRLGMLSGSDCGGVRALQVVLWSREPNGIRSQPFGSISGYRDEDLSPGRELEGVLMEALR